MLHGPDERVKELVSRFQKEQQRFAGEQLAVTELSVNDRGAWSLQFANGLKIAVGRDDVENRLQRLARYLDTIRQVKGMPESIDLRYQHGMAVMWKQIDKQDNEEKRAEGAV